MKLRLIERKILGLTWVTLPSEDSINLTFETSERKVIDLTLTTEEFDILRKALNTIETNIKKGKTYNG